MHLCGQARVMIIWLYQVYVCWQTLPVSMGHHKQLVPSYFYVWRFRATMFHHRLSRAGYLHEEWVGSEGSVPSDVESEEKQSLVLQVTGAIASLIILSICV